MILFMVAILKVIVSKYSFFIYWPHNFFIGLKVIKHLMQYAIKHMIANYSRKNIFHLIIMFSTDITIQCKISLIFTRVSTRSLLRFELEIIMNNKNQIAYESFVGGFCDMQVKKSHLRKTFCSNERQHDQQL